MFEQAHSKEDGLYLDAQTNNATLEDKDYCSVSLNKLADVFHACNTLLILRNYICIKLSEVKLHEFS